MKAKVLELRPTQIAVGMKEVELRTKKLRDMKSHELEEHLKDRRPPVVLGPKSRTYIVDRHHHARACWEAGIDEIPVEQKADFSHLAPAEFWKALETAHWVHLYDQFGAGPHDPIQLPPSVRGLADDPYRSLAWMVRREGGYEKTEAPFSEFIWADFFRKNLKLHPAADHYEDACREALELAKSKAASALPGFERRKH